jgi:hypothetical protein
VLGSEKTTAVTVVESEGEEDRRRRRRRFISSRARRTRSLLTTLARQTAVPRVSTTGPVAVPPPLHTFVVWVLIIREMMSDDVLISSICFAFGGQDLGNFEVFYDNLNIKMK